MATLDFDFPECPYDLDEGIRKSIYSLENRVKKITAVRIDESFIYVFGCRHPNVNYSDRIEITMDKRNPDTIYEEKVFRYPGIRQDMITIFTFGKKGSIQSYEQMREHYKKCAEMVKNNIDQAKSKLNIHAYLEDKKQIELELGKKLERVEDENLEKFITINHDKPDIGLLLLKIKAYKLGADLIVSYKQNNNCHMGTPLKIVGK